MLDYYLYLWQIAWFEALGFLALSLYIIVNLIWKTVDFHRQGWESFARLRFVFRIAAWIGVLSIYLIMLYRTEPDWFAKPQWVQGKVQGKSMNPSQTHPYMVEIQAETGYVALYIDGFVYQELNPGQQVKLSYLPHRLEAVNCEILAEAEAASGMKPAESEAAIQESN